LTDDDLPDFFPDGIEPCNGFRQGCGFWHNPIVGNAAGGRDPVRPGRAQRAGWGKTMWVGGTPFRSHHIRYSVP
jgi:hypothetical protein